MSYFIADFIIWQLVTALLAIWIIRRHYKRRVTWEILPEFAIRLVVTMFALSIFIKML